MTIAPTTIRAAAVGDASLASIVRASASELRERDRGREDGEPRVRRRRPTDGGDDRDRRRAEVDDRDRGDQRRDPRARRDPERRGEPRGLAVRAERDQRGRRSAPGPARSR